MKRLMTIILIGTIFTTGCTHICTPVEPLVRHPKPILLQVPVPFAGGVLRVATEDGFVDDIIRAEAWYQDQEQWRLIGVDNGLDPHLDRHRDHFRFKWDIGNLMPGEVPVRITMFQVNGGFGEAIMMVNLLPSEPAMAHVPDVPLNVSYLSLRLKKLRDVIDEKRKLRLGGSQSERRDKLVGKLEDAKAGLGEANRLLGENPPSTTEAEAKLKEARDLLKEAREIARQMGFSSLLPSHTREKMRENVVHINQLDIELAFLEGRLWLTGKLDPGSPYVSDDPEKAFPLPPADQDIGDNDVSFWDGTTIHIDTSILDKVSDDTVFHELDHAWLEKKQKRNKLPGGGHTLTEDLAERERDVTLPNGKTIRRKLGYREGRQLAFSEAWADFSSAAKRGKATYHGVDIERPEHAKRDDGTEIKGPSVEQDVLAMFWDLYDGSADHPTDDDSDGLAVPFKYLLKAMNPDGRKFVPTTISEFRRRLVGELASDAHPPWTEEQINRLDNFFRQRGLFE